MTFKSAVLYMAPDGDPETHRVTIKTSKLELTTVLIQADNFDQAVNVCKTLVHKDGIEHIMLCPGFTHESLGKIKEVVGEKVAVSVARSDVPGNTLVTQILTREGWFPQES